MSGPKSSGAQPAPRRPLFRPAGLLPVVWGVAAGCAALVLDSAIALLTGASVGWTAEIAWVYLVSGAMAAGWVALLGRWLGPRLPRLPKPIEIGSLALALPYIVPLWERLDAQMHLGVVMAVVMAALALFSLAAWLLLLRRLADSLWPAATLSALTASAALTVNRNLLDAPLAPASLAADAAILLTAPALALACRRLGAVHTLCTVGAALALASSGAWWVQHDGPTDMAPTVRAAPSQERPPHVLLLTVDTLRLDVYDDVAKNTPEGQAFVDALGDAIEFTQARAPSPWTAPSVATLMTGLLPDEHGYGVRTGIEDRPLSVLPPELPTLAEGLAAHGYRTEALVANPLLFPGSGIDRGFHEYHALQDAGRTLPWMRIFALQPIRKVSRRWRSQWIRSLPYVQADRVANLATDRIRRLGDDPSPLFLWVHLMDPHAPYVRHAGLTEGLDSESPERKADRYRGEVRFTLRHATRILESLDAAGVADRTVVVFTSDHGEMFPADRHVERGADGKVRRAGHGHSLHAEVVRVPLAIRAAGPRYAALRAPATGRPDDPGTPVSLADVPPTLEDLLGVPLGLQGTPSARSLIASASPRAGRPLLLSGNEWGPRQRGLILGRWKLVHFPDGEESDRLFGLVGDPREQRDLADRRPRRVEKLLRRLVEEWAGLRPLPSAEGRAIDEETRRRLEALGYLTE